VSEQTQQMEFEDVLPEPSEVMKDIDSQVEDFEIEVIDDRPEEDRRPPRVEDPNDTFDIDAEIEGVDSSVKKRINRMKYEYHEQRRAKEEAEREKLEAINFAQSQQSENQRLNNLLSRSEQALLSSVSTRADAEIAAAEQAYKKAHEENDTEALLNAQRKLAQAQADKSYLQNYQPQQAQENQNQPVNGQSNGQDYQPVNGQSNDQDYQQQPQFDIPTQNWLQKNPWWNQPGYEPVTEFTKGLHLKLSGQGIDSSNPDYFKSIEKEVGNRFPDFFSNNQVSNTVALRKQSSTVVAPAKRGQKNPKRVKLTESAVRVAKRLGLTPEQYAAQLYKESR
tara:strand:+ start:337 stop:1344 length:1008 start_codon:yes stop_codon:yes gene_type:complete